MKSITYHLFPADKGCFPVGLDIGFILDVAFDEKLALQEDEVLDKLVGHICSHKDSVEDAEHLVDQLEQVILLCENFTKYRGKILMLEARCEHVSKESLARKLDPEVGVLPGDGHDILSQLLRESIQNFLGVTAFE